MNRPGYNTRVLGFPQKVSSFQLQQWVYSHLISCVQLKANTISSFVMEAAATRTRPKILSTQQNAWVHIIAVSNWLTHPHDHLCVGMHCVFGVSNCFCIYRHTQTLYRLSILVWCYSHSLSPPPQLLMAPLVVCTVPVTRYGEQNGTKIDWALKYNAW